MIAIFATAALTAAIALGAAPALGHADTDDTAVGVRAFAGTLDNDPAALVVAGVAESDDTPVTVFVCDGADRWAWFELTGDGGGGELFGDGSVRIAGATPDGADTATLELRFDDDALSGEITFADGDHETFTIDPASGPDGLYQVPELTATTFAGNSQSGGTIDGIIYDDDDGDDTTFGFAEVIAGPDGSELHASGTLTNLDRTDLAAYGGLRVAVHHGTAVGISKREGRTGFVEKIVF